jgi:hypothetical protein
MLDVRGREATAREKEEEMNPMVKTLERIVVAFALAGLVVAVLAPSVGYARHGPLGHATATGGSTSTWVASGREIDRLGPKQLPLQHAIVAQPTAPDVVRVVEPGGFDWGDALIGAGVAAGATAAVAAALQMLTGGRRGRFGRGHALAR